VPENCRICGQDYQSCYINDAITGTPERGGYSSGDFIDAENGSLIGPYWTESRWNEFVRRTNELASNGCPFANQIKQHLEELTALKRKHGEIRTTLHEP
jgi:hypothetical protein